MTFPEVTLPKSITARPLTIRVQSIADLPDPDLAADIIDAAVAADPLRARDLLKSDDAELDLWIVDGGATVWVGDVVLWRSVPEADR